MTTARGGRPSGYAVNGPRLRRIRVRHKISAAALARSIGRAEKTLYRAEGGGPITETLAQQIADALTRIGPPVKPRDFMAAWPEGDDEEDAAEPLAS